MSRAQAIVASLGMAPHPEGGFFVETFRSPDPVVAADGRQRASGTAIYFLLARGDFSAWHRVASDEIWHFYDGDPLELHLLEPGGHRVVHLGRDLQAGERPQAVVPAGVLQAARTTGAFTLVGCTVSPGFDFADFEMPSAQDLMAAHPQAEAAIAAFTR